MSRRGVQLTIAVGAVVMAALVVASTGRPVPLLARPSAFVATIPPLPTATPPLATTTPASRTITRPPAPFDPSPILVALVQILLVGTILVVLLALARLLVALVRTPHVTVHEEPTFAIPLVPAELLEAARERLRDLESGEPRNAIVAAWLDLEGSAAATGLPRLPAETSTEYTERVITVWAVDRERLADLAALYREARFSAHPLGEEHRSRAIGDLRVLIADLERVADEQASADAAAHADAPTGAGATARGTGSPHREAP
ncbi:MAG: DUF4129 domain-containing protein [Terrabacter sp.]|nr:DUF4129 domain-containing protein [Dermatophilaceae bacterium]NUS40968.1 DUF4129 domain-containing protein [Terrabacter sp.]